MLAKATGALVIVGLLALLGGVGWLELQVKPNLRTTPFANFGKHLFYKPG